eukprot:189070-Amorphochlora_amoeboformis.AAC.1
MIQNVLQLVFDNLSKISVIARKPRIAELGFALARATMSPGVGRMYWKNDLTSSDLSHPPARIA